MLLHLHPYPYDGHNCVCIRICIIVYESKKIYMLMALLIPSLLQCFLDFLNYSKTFQRIPWDMCVMRFQHICTSINTPSIFKNIYGCTYGPVSQPVPFLFYGVPQSVKSQSNFIKILQWMCIQKHEITA